MIENQGLNLPNWLNCDYLFNINYGPASREDTLLASQLKTHRINDRSERARITLLDRRIADKLHFALFNYSAARPPFATDFKDGKPIPDLEMNPSAKNTNVHRVTPFDYDSLNDENSLLTRLEDFVVRCVWCSGYSSTILGLDARPPMAAVAMDVIDMVNYLKTFTETPCSVATCLLEFLRDYPRSLQHKFPVNHDSVVRSYLADLFRIVIALDFDLEKALGWDHIEANRRETFADYQDFRFLSASWADRKQFPSELYSYDQSIEHPTPGLHTYYSLELLDAETIHNGPFQITFTDKLREHLTLTHDNKIRLFWEGRNNTMKRYRFPGESFSIYKGHTLGG